MTKKQKSTLLRIIIATLGTAALVILPLSDLLRTVFSLCIYGLIGYDVLRKAFRGIRNGRVLDENFLMTLATAGAIGLALHQRSFDFTEAIAVMLFYQIGELFESYAIGKSRRSIRSLMDIRPDYANIEQDGRLIPTDPETVPVGSTIVVQPGERIPIDGTILSGSSALDTAALTGESLPREVSEGDAVVSGCINLTGMLRVVTTRAFADSTVSKILELVEESGSRKSRSENFIARFSRIYTPVVCLGALALAILPPALNFLLENPIGWDIWIYRALTFLVISCPCALVISIPLSFFAGIGGASREGILIKGSNYLEALSNVKTVVLDKTGTLTHGVFSVTGIFPITMSEKKLLEYAAMAECASPHPISKSLIAAFGQEIDRNRVADITEISGKGVTATVDGISVAVGNNKLMCDLGVSCPESVQAGTVLSIAVAGAYAGHITVADTLKPNARKSIDDLRSTGVEKIVMLTGDNKTAAESVAADLQIRQVYHDLLPADKVAIVEDLISATKGKLVFVGDGMNDAPVLSRADIGIAMGAMGSDAAIEAADVVLMDDDPAKIAKAIKLSRKCLRIVRQNIIFSLGVKFSCLLLGALGFANMWFAIFADVGVMVLAVLNAIRALNTRRQ